MNPEISIMMPAKNESRYIAAAIESIINQTYQNWELIIVDDKSTDATKEIATTFAIKDARIKVIDGDGICAANARNKAIKIAQGAYIMNMDSDDISEPDRVARLLSAASQHEFPVIGSNILYTKTDLSPVKKTKLPLTNKKIRAGFERAYNRMVIMPQTILTTTLLLQQYPYNEQYKLLEDWDLILRLSENEKVFFENIEEPLYIYRKNLGSETMNYKPLVQYNILIRYNELQRRHKKQEIKTLDNFNLEIKKNIKLKLLYYFVFYLKMIQYGFFLFKVKIWLK